LILNFDGLNRKLAYAIGISGAFLYFSKAYGIFYFPLLIAFAYFLNYKNNRENEKRKIILLNAGATFAIFLFCSAIWVSALSYKYGRFVLTNAVSYNLQIKDSAKSGVEEEH